MIAASSRCRWGWTSPARGVLGTLAVAGAFGLFVVSPEEGRPVDPAPRLVVDPNTAPPQVLGALPKLGPSLVRGIVAARAEAPFQSLEDLDARVRGIGPATIEALRPYLRIRSTQSPTSRSSSTSPSRMASYAR